MAYTPNFNDPIYGWNAPSVDPRQTGGILSGQAAGGGPLSGAGGWQARAMQFLDPQYALPIAAQLIGGANPQASLAGAFQAAGQAIPDMQRRTALNDWLKAGAPKDIQHPATVALMAADPTLGRAYLAQQFTQPTSSDITEYEYAKKQGFTGTFMDFSAQQKAKATDPAEADNVSAISDAIINGDQPPVTTGLYHYGPLVKADMAKKGFNFTKQNEDWTATQKRMSVMNSSKQLSLVSAVNQVDETLPLIEQLTTQWQGSGFKPLNKANLELARQGVLGQEAQSLATRLSSAIADITSELGTVYKGGNASTDESLRLAAENLQADWSAETMLDNIKQIKQQLVYRKNSMKLLTQGTPGNRYDQPVAPEAAPTAPAGAPAVAPAGGAQEGQTASTKDGHQIVVRNGQWVDAQTGQPIQ